MNFSDWPIAALISQQLLTAILSFLAGAGVGTIFGWTMRGFMKNGNVTGKKVAVMVVNIIIVILWTLSVANDIFQFNDATTPFFLHVLMGAVMGYLNEGIGNWVLKIIGKLPPDSK